jgi:sn-glycerol 3-phosphate transport system substrate-binding protein
MVLIMIAPLFGAGKKDVTTEVDEITVWHYGADYEMEFMKTAIEEFNAQSTTSQATFVERPEAKEAIATAIAGGQGPDVMFYNHNSVWYFGLDALYPLNDFVHDPKIGMNADDFLPAPRMSCNYGGKVIAIPYSFGLGAVMYNLDMLETAGLDPANPPQTWAELEEWAKKLTISKGDEVVQWGFSCESKGWLLQEIMFANGGDWNNDDMSEYAPYVEELIGGLEWVNRLVNELGVMPVPRGVNWGGATELQATREDFANGKVAMQLGYHAWNRIIGQNPNLRIGVFPIPKGPLAGDTVRISTGYNGMHVMHNASNPKESYLFIKWFIENKSVDFSWLTYRFPAYAASLEKYENDPAYAPMIPHLEKSPVRRFHVFPARLDVRSEEPAILDNVLLGIMSPREAVETFKKHADRVFAENRAELDDFIRIQKIVW